MKRPLSTTRAIAASISARSGASGVAVSKSGTPTVVGRLPNLFGGRIDDTATGVGVVRRRCAKRCGGGGSPAGSSPADGRQNAISG